METPPDYLKGTFAGLAAEGERLGAWRAIAAARLAEMQRLAAAGDLAACHAVEHGTDDRAAAGRIDPRMRDEVARWIVELAEAPVAPPLDAVQREYRAKLRRGLVRRAGAEWTELFADEGGRALERLDVGCRFGIAWLRELLALPEYEINLVSRDVD